MKSLKEIKDLILKGDLKKMFSKDSKEKFYPSEIATVRLLGFRNNGKMGDYRQALALSPTAPNVDTTQAYGRHKYGFAISADQYLSKDFGVFAKASWNDGHTETWYFTEIDRSISLGGVLKGTSWKRMDDELGLAFIGNGLSQ